jgi:succinoglycan biosynthesis transport protein ExoP
VNQIERVDSLMHEYVAVQTLAEGAWEAGRARGLGDGHPEMDRLRLQLEKATERVERYAQEYRSTQAVVARYAVGGPAVAKVSGGQSLEILRADQAVIDEALENTSRQMARLSIKRMELAPFKAEAEKVRVELDAKRSRKELLETERALGQDIELISGGEVPLRPVRDTRRKYLAAGSLAGGGFPIGLLLLFCVLNRRYRYSDEAASDVAATASAPLLGTLPALCDRLDEPEHAASAAQCIHQIRALLQVSRPAARQSVYLITSSTAGEGKTSVAVSLALSFAASGARTLLVDCDIVGQSITRGFGADGRPGLRDALARGTVRGFAHRTEVGPYLVGVGTSDVLDAAVVSSMGMRRLLLDARRYFDAIIVDSGPILGSIEATAVAAEVDGVIFAVSRGQQPVLAERAIRHLQAIGATIAGFVFNRAAAKDFSGWAQSSSLRSAGSKAGGPRPPFTSAGPLAKFGPLVRAVASLMPGARALLAAPARGGAAASAAVAAQAR